MPLFSSSSSSCRNIFIYSSYCYCYLLLITCSLDMWPCRFWAADNETMITFSPRVRVYYLSVQAKQCSIKKVALTATCNLRAWLSCSTEARTATLKGEDILSSSPQYQTSYRKFNSVRHSKLTWINVDSWLPAYTHYRWTAARIARTVVCWHLVVNMSLYTAHL